jgi:exonuclease VII small subunit
VTEARDPTDSLDADSDATPVADLSYADASRELDGIVEFFEHRDVDVDQLVARLKRATALVDELDRRVRRTRSQVEQLVPRLQTSARPAVEESESEEAPMDDPDDEPGG